LIIIHPKAIVGKASKITAKSIIRSGIGRFWSYERLEARKEEEDARYKTQQPRSETKETGKECSQNPTQEMGVKWEYPIW
jgi:hypothetical protein